MDEREIIYERVSNYTKYKLVEMLIEKHKDKFKNLNQVEELADEILQVLSIAGLKHYNDLKGEFNADRD
jgi:NTP pyrophosphatase (non-canonical NTP hydrolase)